VSAALVTRFFAVMNDHDGSAVEALFDPQAEIAMGPNVARGFDEIREIVLQEGPPDLDITTRPTGYETVDGGAVVPFVRTQVWRESGELAVEEELWAAFSFGGDRITRAELHQERP
jgi:hypothetical protein